MCQRGLVDALLGMLRALPPITKPNAAPAAASASRPLTPYPADVPYQGYRSDLVAGKPCVSQCCHCCPEHIRHSKVMRCRSHPVATCPAVLANAAFGRSPVQQQVSDGGGVELLLEQCQVRGISAQVAWWFAGTASCMAD